MLNVKVYKFLVITIEISFVKLFIHLMNNLIAKQIQPDNINVI